MEEISKTARDYDKLMWNLIYIGFGLSLFILFTIHSDSLKQELTPNLKILLCLFGILVFSYFSVIIEKTNWRKNQYLNKDKLFLPIYFQIKGIIFLRIIKIFMIFSYLSTSLFFLIRYINNIYILLTSIIIIILSIITLGFEVSLFFWKKSK